MLPIKILKKLTEKTPERHHWLPSGVFIVNFEHVSHLFLVFLLLPLSMYLWARKLCQVFSSINGNRHEKILPTDKFCVKLVWNKVIAKCTQYSMPCDLLISRKTCVFYVVCNVWISSWENEHTLNSLCGNSEQMDL